MYICAYEKTEMSFYLLAQTMYFHFQRNNRNGNLHRRVHGLFCQTLHSTALFCTVSIYYRLSDHICGSEGDDAHHHHHHRGEGGGGGGAGGG